MPNTMRDEEPLTPWISPSQQNESRILPGRNLAAAVLLQAIADINVQRGVLRGRRANDPTLRGEFGRLKTWFASEKTDWPFAFRNLCDALDLDATAIRRAVGVAAPSPSRTRGTPAHESRPHRPGWPTALRDRAANTIGDA